MVHPAWREVLCDVDIGSIQHPVQVKFRISETKEKQIQKRSGTKKFTADPIVYDISLQSSLITPILYKLFSRMFCERIQTTLMSQQSSDQAAYRAGYSTEDHLLTVTLMTELCSEWRSELWLGLIDFEKAFDTVEHDVLWEVLKDQGLHSDYIDIIKRLYDGQTAYVQARAASRRFPLLRGEARKSNLAQRRARCKVQTDRLVRSPASMQATDGMKSADYAVAPMAGPNSGMDTMVSHKFYEK